MSADNWAFCPRCLGHAKTEAVAQEQAVAAKYGHLSMQEFDRLRAGIAPVDPEKYRTFREDYEIGVDGGDVAWEYSGSCTICGLNTSVKGRKRFWDSVLLQPINDTP